MQFSKRPLAGLIPLLMAGTVAAEETKGSELVIEEIMVTAQKRAQSAQDVPLGISAFSGEDLKEMDAKNVGAIVTRTPGLNGGFEFDTQSVLTVRGIGTAAFSSGADNSVGTYFDEIPINRNVGSQGFLDVERVEVVKGPQGTLFGRNSSAGAISITNNRANFDENTLDLRAQVGNEGQLLVEAVGNLVASENLAFRIAARHDERDGTFTSSVSGDDLNNRDNDQWRVGAHWTPADSVDVNVFVEGYDVESQMQQAFLGEEFNSEVAAVATPDQEVDNLLSGLKVVWDLNEEYIFTSNTGYFTSDILVQNQDFLPIGIPVVTGVEPWDIDQFTQEFRINKSTEDVDWFIGASYFYEEATASTTLSLFEDVLWNVLTDDFETDFCGPGGLFDSEGIACGNPALDDGFSSNETTSYAVYGDVTWRVSEKLTLTLGGRYTTEEKDMTINSLLLPTAEFLLGDNLINLATNGNVKSDDDWSSFDPRVAVSYFINDESMAYFNYSKGFKSGGFNKQPDRPHDDPDQPQGIRSFDPEDNDAYELGIKADLGGGRARINAAVFWYDYSDFQLETTEGFAFVINNVAAMTTKGFELDATYLLTESLDVQVTYAYLDAEFDDGIVNDPDLGPIDLTGRRAPRSPENSVSVSSNYYMDFAGGELKFHADWSYVGGVEYHPYRTEIHEDSYNVLNLRADYTPASESWGVSLIGDNVTNEKYAVMKQVVLAPMVSPAMGDLWRLEIRKNF